MSGRPTPSLEDYPRESAMSEPELIHAYGGLSSALRDPAVSEGLAPRDLQPDLPSAEDLERAAQEAEDAMYDRWRDIEAGL